jgi:hypothetical protein
MANDAGAAFPKACLATIDAMLMQSARRRVPDSLGGGTHMRGAPIVVLLGVAFIALLPSWAFTGPEMRQTVSPDPEDRALAPDVQRVASKRNRAKPETIRGRLIVGSLEGVIETSDGTMYSFASKDRIAWQLLAGCRNTSVTGELCEAEVIAEDLEIKRVLKVRQVLR